MLMVPHTLALVTTYRCTAACEHCCFDCSPRQKDTLAAADMHRFIDQAKELETIRVVVFTGGECFLLGKDLDELVGHAAENGFVTRFVSNGYWGTTREGARRRLERLKQRGLKEANFSTGEQHSRFVPVASVRNAAMAAADLGLVSLVAVDSFGESTFNFDEFLKDRDFREHVDAGTVVLKVSPWMKFNGKRPIAYTSRHMEQLQQHRVIGCGCPTVLKVLAIAPSYKLYACCGLTVQSIPEMEIGSLKGPAWAAAKAGKRATLSGLIRNTPDDFMKIWIHLHGPDAVLRYAQKLDRSIPTPPGQAHVCDICRSIYQSPRIRELVMANPPPNMSAIIAEYRQSLLMPPGDQDSKLSIELLRAGGDVKRLKALHRQTVFNPPRGSALRSPGPCGSPGTVSGLSAPVRGRESNTAMPQVRRTNGLAPRTRRLSIGGTADCQSALPAMPALQPA